MDSLTRSLGSRLAQANDHLADVLHRHDRRRYRPCAHCGCQVRVSAEHCDACGGELPVKPFSRRKPLEG